MQLTAWKPKGGEGIQLQPPKVIESVTKLIIYDDIGQPLMVLLQQSPTHVWVVKQGDSDFDSALLSLGIKPIPMRVVKAALPETPK